MGGIAFAVIPLLFAWGVAGFVLSPALQARVVGAAGPGNTLASSLNISAFNVGIAAGSLVGTAVVADGGLASTPFVAAGLAAIAIAPALLGSRRSMMPALEPDVPAVTAPMRGLGLSRCAVDQLRMVGIPGSLRRASCKCRLVPRLRSSAGSR